MSRNDIKIAKVIKNTKDDEKFPSFQITYLDKVANAAILLPYGLTARPIPGETLCLVFSILGQEENRIAVPLGTTNRKKGLKDGETVLENQETGAFIYLDENGDLQINVPRHIVEICQNLTITASGDIAITATGTAALVAAGLTIEAPTSITGDVDVTGDVGITGQLGVSGEFGCNGATPQAPHTINAATGLNNTTVINQIRSALINNGIGQ